ncbi:hypothetical protein ACWPKO_12040 [Coraliomargarita sp. W4R53]
MLNHSKERSEEPLKVAFFIEPNERGTAVAVYDYAHFNEKILGNRSYIFMSSNGRGHPANARFEERFEVVSYESNEAITAELERRGIQVCYQLIHGRRELGQPSYRVPEGCKQVVHCVFSTKDPCGDVYAAISPYLNDKCGTDCPVVPHMIHLPAFEADLRAELGIPENATVFGRYGGRDTFSVKLAHQVIAELVQERPNYYFIFMNTDAFCEPHQQIIHLPASFDLEEKVRFINTCDAMLHARRDGETFGIAVGEFSIKNKPIFTFAPPESGFKRWKYLFAQSFKSITKTGQRLPKRTSIEHINILGDKAQIYCCKHELKEMLEAFDPQAVCEMNWDCYSERFSPEPVMRQFERVFLRGVTR